MAPIRYADLGPGDIIHSSHGYRLLLTEVNDRAINRHPTRHVEIRGHIHADPEREIVTERHSACGIARLEDVGKAAEDEPEDSAVSDDARTAIRQFLDFGEQTKGTAHKGYFSRGGWAADTLRRFLGEK